MNKVKIGDVFATTNTKATLKADSEKFIPLLQAVIDEAGQVFEGHTFTTDELRLLLTEPESFTRNYFLQKAAPKYPGIAQDALLKMLQLPEIAAIKQKIRQFQNGTRQCLLSVWDISLVSNKVQIIDLDKRLAECDLTLENEQEVERYQQAKQIIDLMNGLPKETVLMHPEPLKRIAIAEASPGEPRQYRVNPHFVKNTLP